MSPDWPVGVALFLLAAWGFASAPTRQYTFDAIAYAWQIERFHDSGNANWLLHPHHLLYNPIAYLWWRLVRGLFGVQRSIEAQQMLSALAGGATVALLYVAARQAVESRRVALGAALLLWASFGLWTIATDGAIYALGLSLCVATLALALRLLRRPRARIAAALGAVAALAGLVHQMHLLLLPAVAAAALLGGRTRREQAMLMLLALGVGCLLPVGVYALAAPLRGLEDAASVGRWLTAYGRDGRWWDFDIRENLRLDLYALTRVFAADAAGVVRRAAGAPHRLEALHVVGLLLLAIPALLTRARQVLLCLGLLLPYAAFFTIWVPGFYAYWPPVAIALILIAAMLFDAGSRTLRPVGWQGMLRAGLRAAALVFCAVLAWRLAMANTPFLERRREVAANPYLAIARDVARQTRGADGRGRSSDLLLIAGAGPYAHLETYIPYFAERNLVTLSHALKHHGPGAGRDRSEAMKWLEVRMQQSWQRGASVYLFPDMIRVPPALTSLTRRYGITSTEIATFLGQFEREYAFTVRGQPVYRLQPAALAATAAP